MIDGKAAAFISVAALVMAACSSGTPPTASQQPLGTTSSPSATAAPATCAVGVSWDDRSGERWSTWDEPAIKKALIDAGATYIATDAKSSAATQATDIESLISQGVKVLLIVARDGTAVRPSMVRAIQRGIPVVAYDRLIEEPRALYISFDNVEVGRMQARALLKSVPKGNYVFIKGDKSDANADFLRSGQDEVVGAAIKSGAVKNVGETYTDAWDPYLAKTAMEQFLKVTNNKVDAVLVENDGMADGVVEALSAQGLAGKVAVSGEDGDSLSLSHVARGTQAIDVWKDARMLGKAAGEAAVELCAGTPVDRISGAAPFKTPGGNTLTSILLKPVPITKDNLDVVLDAGWITKHQLCEGVTAGSVAACR